MNSPAPLSAWRTSPPAAEPGPVGRAVLKLLAHPAHVDEVHVLSPRFRLVSLRCAAFRRGDHVAGDKLQVRVGGMALRTFTPIRRAGADDTLELLAYLHGDAPAARWLASVQPGDRCDAMGPRRSLDLAAIQRSTVFFGDETALGLALALCTTRLGGLDTHFIFEVDDVQEVGAVLATLGRGMLRHAWLVQRRAAGAHLEEIAPVLLRYAAADAGRQYVLAGQLLAIRQLQRVLKGVGVKPSQMLVKAYWAPGKTALD